MTSTNGWNVVGAMTEAFLTSEITALFDRAVSAGIIPNPITIGGVEVTLSDPSVTIAPDPDTDTGWANCVEIQIDGSVGSASGVIAVKVNPAEIFLGVVRQSTYLSSNGSAGSGANCGALPSSLPTTGYTVGGWVMLNAYGDQTLFSVLDGGSTTLALSLSGSKPSLTCGGKVYTYTPGSYAPTLTIGTWHHVAAVIDPDAGVTFYIDGQPQGSASIAAIPEISGTFQVGVAAGQDSPMNGNATGVSVWSSPLTASELQLLMNADPSSGALPSGLTCVGYWLFDPSNRVNLMHTATTITVEGGASLVQNDSPSSESYLYFASDDASDIFSVSNTIPGVSTQITNAIEAQLTKIVQEGAVSLGGGLSADTSKKLALDATPSYLGFVTEASGDWSGPAQLIGFVTNSNAIPPTSDAKSSFASDSTMQVPGDDNIAIAVWDYYLFSVMADSINSAGKGTATVSSDPVELTITFGGSKLHKYDVHQATVVLSIANGKGIAFDMKIEFGIAGGHDTWIIDVSGIASFTVASGGSTPQLELSFSDVDVSVTANQGSSFVQTFQEIVQILDYTGILFWLGALCEGVAELWRGILFAGISKVVNQYLGEDYFFPIPTTANFELDQIAFEDGIVVYGTVTPRGAIITGVTPETGSPGAVVTITGQGFVDTSGASLLSVANLGGQLVALDSVSGTPQAGTAKATVVSGGTGKPTAVQLQTTSKLWSNAYGSFVVTGTVAPSDVTFTPSSGVAGDAITISGSGFTGTTKVAFGGISASYVVVSDRSITATVPALVQEGAITVTNNKGPSSSSSTFTLLSAPGISSLDPTSGPPGTVVTITGTGFFSRTDDPMKALFSLSPGSQNAMSSGTDVASISEDGTTATVTVPLGVTGGYVEVSTAAGTSGGSPFTVEGAAAPTVKSFSPSSGKALTYVTVYGTNFTGATTVTVGGTSCSFSLDADSGDTKLQLFLPTNAASGVIKVESSAGSGASSSTFYVLSRPTISNVSPLQGQAETSVTISGANFMDGGGASVVTGVQIGLASATYSVSSSSKIVASVPYGGVGIAGSVVVNTSAGTATSNQKFTVQSSAAPTISSFSPTSGAAGTAVTVTGTHFTGMTKVTLGDTTCLFTLASDSSLSFTVPSSLGAGSYAIALTNTVGTTTSSTKFAVTG